jgi:hypothetical protein
MDIATSTVTNGITTYALTAQGFLLINEAFRQILMMSSFILVILVAFLAIKFMSKNG